MTAINHRYKFTYRDTGIGSNAIQVAYPPRGDAAKIVGLYREFVNSGTFSAGTAGTLRFDAAEWQGPDGCWHTGMIGPEAKGV